MVRMVSCTSAVSWVRSPPAVCLGVLQEVARPEQTLAGLLNKRELISSSKLYTGQRHTEQTGQSQTKTAKQTQRREQNEKRWKSRKEGRLRRRFEWKKRAEVVTFTIKRREHWKDVHSHAHIHLI